jgi:enamine deaminase RidA (YjgF/YER057c/UK114 family)
MDANLLAAAQAKITRLPGVSPYRSSGSAYNGLVFCLSTARNKEVDMAEQARLTFARLDTLLEALGSHKSLILQTTIYIGDAALKPEFDAEWKKWIGEDPQGWPPRAGIGVVLSEGTYCEVVLVAAQADSSAPSSVTLD